MECLVAGCTNPIKTGRRGLCVPHYHVAAYRIRKGMTTWEELERLGLSNRQNRLNHADFDAQLAKRRAEVDKK